MNWQHIPYTLPLLAAAGISTGLALYSWRKERGARATPFVFLMVTLVVWSAGYALELASVEQANKIFWARVQYLGIAPLPVAWLAFALQYAGWERWLTRRNVAALTIEPCIMLLLVWTNDIHGLIWQRIELDTSGLFSVLDLTHGPLFWTHVVYAYLLLLGGTLLLLWALVRAPRLYRGQIIVVLIGALAPWVGNVLYISGLNPFPGLDPTPFGYVVTGLVTTWGLFRFRLLDRVPVARDAVVTGMADGVIVLDAKDRIVDLNPAAERIIGRSISEAAGQPADRVLSSWPDLVESYHGVEDAYTEIATHEGDAQRIYELRISPMRDRRDRLTGHLIVLHDITDHKQVENALVAQKQWFEKLVAVARATAERFTLDATLQNVLEVATSLTGAEHGSLFLLGEDDVVTHAILARGKVTPAQEQEIVSMVMEQGLSGRVVRDRKAALVSDTTHDDRWLMLPDTPYTARSALVVPIMSRSSVLGVLNLTHPEVDHFNAEHLEWTQAAADHMALALRNAQIYDAQRRLANRQATLYEVLRAVGAYLDPEDVVKVAVIVVARMTGWPAVAVLLADQESVESATHLVVEAAAGVLSGAEGRHVSIEQGVTGRAFRMGQTQYVPDVRADPDYVAGDPAIYSELAVLLRRGERVLGVLNIESDRRSAFDAEDIQLAESLSEAIALAVDTARLFKEAAHGRGRLQALIEASRDGIILVEMDGRVPVVNAPALELLGLPGQPEDWIGRSVRDSLIILRGHVPKVARAALDEVRRIKRGDEPPGEGECEAPPRTIHWLNLPVMSDTTPLGRLLILHDVTEERLLDRMRDDLIHTMVHDLRNPLTSISVSLQFLDTLLTDSGASYERQALDIAQESTQNMLGLVSAILDISRLETGRMPLVRTQVSLDDLVAGVLDSQSPLATEKSLRLESDIPPDLPPAWIDAKLIERVLQNLVGNAIKFTPTDGVIRVAARVDETVEHPRLLVSVSDTGPGIPPEIQDRLFQKFVAGRQEQRGSGLGLAFCRMAVEAHGERIWAESTPGSGTTFFYTLPVVPSEAEEAPYGETN